MTPSGLPYTDSDTSMANKRTPNPDITSPEAKHRIGILKEALRNFTDFEQYVTDTGIFEVSCNGFTVNFLDLQKILHGLDQKQQDAIYLNVIRDQRQQHAVKPLGVKNDSAVTLLVNRGLANIAEAYFQDTSLLE